MGFPAPLNRVPAGDGLRNAGRLFAAWREFWDVGPAGAGSR